MKRLVITCTLLAFAAIWVPAVASASPVMSGDPQSECVWTPNYDPAPFMQLHHATVLRLIVTSLHPDGVRGGADGPWLIPGYQQALTNEEACARNARAEGYRVIISYEWPMTWTPAQVASWFAQVLPDFPDPWAVSIGNEQDYQYWTGEASVATDPSLVCTRTEGGYRYVWRPVYRLVGARRHGRYRWIRGVVNVRRRIRRRHHSRWVVMPKTHLLPVDVPPAPTCVRATGAQQYRLDYNAAEPVVAQADPRTLIGFGTVYPFGQEFIESAWVFGGRPAGADAIAMTGYWLVGLPPVAAFARSQGLQFWTLENNPNGPGGSGSTKVPSAWPTLWAAVAAAMPNWTIDDFYS